MPRRTPPMARGSDPSALLAADSPPGIEDQLQILDLAQLVIDRQQRLDDVLDLARHAIELLKRHALQLASDLLVQAQEVSKSTRCREAAVHLVIGGEDAVDQFADLLGHDRTPSRCGKRSNRGDTWKAIPVPR